MEKILEKISSYNILNNLLPGATFYYLLKFFIGIDIIQTNIIDNLILYYFFGIIVNRVGAIVIEPICKKAKFLSYVEYKDYLSACKTDEKIEVLLETNNMYRTFLSVCILVLVIWAYYKLGNQFQILFDIIPIVVTVLLIVLFCFRL